MQKVEQILFSALSRTASDDIFLQDVSKKAKKKEINSKKICWMFEVRGSFQVRMES